jgi:hypothetical protein
MLEKLKKLLKTLKEKLLNLLFGTDDKASVNVSDVDFTLNVEEESTKPVEETTTDDVKVEKTKKTTRKKKKIKK